MQRSLMDFLLLLIFSIKTNAQQQTPFLYPFISGGYSFLIVTRASNPRPRSRVARFRPRKFHEIDGKRFWSPQCRHLSGAKLLVGQGRAASLP
jgi:hypothetical protein